MSRSLAISGFTLCAACYVAASDSAAHDRLPGPAQIQVTAVTLTTNLVGHVVATLGHTTHPLASAPPARFGPTADGLTFRAGDDDHSIAIAAETAAAVVRATGFPGWTARVPQGCRATFRVDRAHALIDLRAPAENRGPIALGFADGGRATIKPSGSARFDLYRDGSYTLSGQGPVDAVNGAGQALSLSRRQPPMTGGPLVEVKNAQGRPQHRQLSPIVRLAFSGQLKAGLTLRVEDRTLEIPPGVEKKLEFPNGSRIVLRRDPATLMLNWRVTKGYFEFQVAGIDCWHPIGLTGQAAAIQWNAAEQAADVRNLTPDRPVLVDLRRRCFAQVSPGAVFQYQTLQDCRTFMASASGGKVMLYNTVTDQETALDINSLLVKSGAPAGNGLRSRSLEAPLQTVLVYGAGGDRYQLQGALGNATILRHSQTTLRRGGAEIQADYTEDSRFVLRAVSGNYLILMPTVAGLSIRLRQGDTVALTVNRAAGLFTIGAGLDNLSTVALRAGAAAPQLEAGGKVTFEWDNRGLRFAGSEGAVVFNEAAGAMNLNPTPRAPLLPSASPVGTIDPAIDVSRIAQPPISSEK